VLTSCHRSCKTFCGAYTARPDQQFVSLQISYQDFQEFASLRKELHKLQVALEFYQKTTGQFNLDDLKVCTSNAASDISALVLIAVSSVLLLFPSHHFSC